MKIIQNPYVSIVMAVYNGGLYLLDTVQSILDQSLTNFELIIVDDGSTDDTWQILTELAERDSRIVLLRSEPNQGVVRALNRGLEISKGMLIARQDADDVSLPERLARQVEFLETNPDYGCVGVAVQMVDPDGTPLGIGFNTSDNDSIQRKLLDNMCICGPTIMVRRECLEAIGMNFSEGLNASEDYDLCLRLAEVTKLAVIEQPLYLYRQHPQSASNTQAQRQAFNKAIALERAIFRRYGPNPSVDKFALVGRDYLRAAVIGVVVKDLKAAKICVQYALKAFPPLFAMDQPLEDLVRSYTPLDSVDAALDYTKTIFDVVLPKTPRLMRMKFRLLSNLHMKEVFSFSRQADIKQVNNHLLAGIYYNPRWLLNRGVISIIMSSLIGKFVKA
jgi:glycosyltransferase involved in cell wall biosynthesis